MQEKVALRRRVGEVYIKFRIRSGRGATYLAEIEGFKGALQSGGMIILLISTYLHYLLPLWIIPVAWIIQKTIEYLIGYADEKHLHWWEYENRYVSSNVNPFLAEMMEKISRIESKLK